MRGIPRLTTAAWNAFGKLYNDGPVEYRFTPFKKAANSNRVSNLDEAMKYRVEGIRPASIEELIDADMIAAQAIDDKHGTFLVSAEKAAEYDHMMGLLLDIGIPKITESNFGEVWARVAMWERLHEITREDESGEERETHIREVWAHVNLTNPDAVPKTRTQFERSVITSMRDIANNQVVTFKSST